MQGTRVHVTNVDPGPVVTGAGVNALMVMVPILKFIASRLFKGGRSCVVIDHTHSCKPQVHPIVRYFFLITASNTVANVAIHLLHSQLYVNYS